MVRRRSDIKIVNKEHGLLAYYSTKGYGHASRVLNTSRSRARYWTIKAKTGTISRSWGGYRWSIFKPWEIPLLQRTILKILATKYDANLQYLCWTLSRMFKRNVKKSTLSNILRAMKWSWKIPTRVQIYKFRKSNVVYYAQFAAWLQTVDW